ncbi:MAG: GNAT family N-acetyltransferase, partial [Bacteroidota bacterium]
WQSSAVKIVRNSGVPVVPVYFDGTNSYAFHLLGLIHPNLRTLALPSELLNKKGHTFRMRIGKPILPREATAFTSNDQYGRYLRAKTYALGSSLDVRRDYFRLFRFPRREDELVPEVGQEQIEREIASIRDLRTLSY